jgi:hypothetical protein
VYREREKDKDKEREKQRENNVFFLFFEEKNCGKNSAKI